MDKDRVRGSAKQAKGSVKETVGKMTGDSKTRAEGAAEKRAGKIQNAVGGKSEPRGPRHSPRSLPRLAYDFALLWF
jgi:uncharacterized protein YjbJ (UPF0337 family)